MAETDSDTRKAYGVTKPVGDVLVSFPGEQDARAAVAALAEAGFGADVVHWWSAQAMRERSAQDIAHAGILATIGQELNLVKAHHALAEQGHVFLSVHAPEDDAARRVAEIASRHNADRAQKYGRLVIEELIEPGTGQRQVAESPDRGLDAQTSSGRELGSDVGR